MEINGQNKRVLVIAPTPFFADRGCHVRILEEARALILLDHQVRICTYHIGRDIEGVKTRRIIRIPWYSKLSAGPSIHKFYSDILLMCTVIRFCLKNRPDIIHAHLHEGVVIGKIASLLFKVPLVADIQGSLTDELVKHKFIKERGVIFQLYRWVEKIIARLPDSTLVSSKKALDFLPAAARNNGRKAEVIMDGVDADYFCPGFASDGLREKLSIPSRMKIVGFLGALTEYQGVSVLLRAIPHIVKTQKQVHFLIMGYPNVEYYQKKAEALNIKQHVTFTGKIAYEDTPKFLSICDIGVSPKLFGSEANGKLLNYMAMGLSVVASDTPVNREILGDLGVYAEEGNPISLAHAIIEVLSDDEYAMELGALLREKATAEYSWHSVGERISEIYNHLKAGDLLKSERDRAVMAKRI